MLLITVKARAKNIHVDRNLGRADADAESVDDTTDNEHGNVLRSTDNDTSNNPDDGSDLDSNLAAETICEVARAESSEPAAASHRGSDATLDVGLGSYTFAVVAEAALIEVAFVRLGSDDS